MTKTQELSVVDTTAGLKEIAVHYLKEQLMTVSLGSKSIVVLEDQKNRFLAHCLYNKLDPYKGEVYAVPFKSKTSKNGIDLVPITSYKVFLNRAMKSGQFGGMTFESIYEDVTIHEVKKNENGKREKTNNVVEKRKWVGIKMTVRRRDWDDAYVEDGLYEDKAKGYKDFNTGVKKINAMREDNKYFMLKKQMIREVIPMVFSEFMGDIQDATDYESEVVVKDVELVDGKKVMDIDNVLSDIDAKENKESEKIKKEETKQK